MIAESQKDRIDVLAEMLDSGYRLCITSLDKRRCAVIVFNPSGAHCYSSSEGDLSAAVSDVIAQVQQVQNRRPDSTG